MRSSRRAVVATTLLGIAALAACEIEKVNIAPSVARLAVHGVLSPTAPSQVVLLERTRNGTSSYFAPPFDNPDPTLGTDADAETDATVLVVTPAGDTVPALEDKFVRDDGKGEGIYRVSIPGPSLVRGATYRLLVRTAAGEEMSAEATVPGGAVAQDAVADTFDRASDTVRLSWPAAPGARSYLVRVETPYGPRAFFTDSTSVRLPGELRNVDARGLPRVFIPGFQQAVTVSAVDSNFYDWYRSSNDFFSGAGLVNRVRGGFGVFGSVVRVRFQELTVTGPRDYPVAGRYEFESEATGAPPLHSSFDLYLESRSRREFQADALSGRYTVPPRFGYTGCLTCGLFGSYYQGTIQLALLSYWSGRDTVDIFTGTVRGDTIVGTYRIAGGVWRFVRRP